MSQNVRNALDRQLAQGAVFDAHVDSLQRALDLGHDLGEEGPGHLDLARGRRGGLRSVVFVCWVDPRYMEEAPGARERTRLLLREFHRLARRHPDRVRFAGNGRELAAVHAAGAVAGIPGIEGGHSIEESLDHLHGFFEHGVRVMTLVWNNHLSWVRSCQPGAGPDVPEGLSAFGRDVVRTMNELGMVVDLSHAGEQSFYDALDTSSKPVIASHSGCKALHGHQRNLTDDQLRALAQNGGVVGIAACTSFLSAAGQAEDERLRATEAYARMPGANDTDQFLLRGEWMQREAEPVPLEVVLDHAVHAIDVCGVDHVGVGTDFDGIQRTPAGLEEASCYPRLAHGLVDRGLAVEDVVKVLGGNMERVYAEVTGSDTRAHEQELATIDG